MTRLLRQHGLDAAHVDARDVLVTDDRFTEAAPLFGPTNERIGRLVRPHGAAGRVVVMGGFIARTADGRPSTLGRGGSDFSASIVGAGIGAEEIQIWTDVRRRHDRGPPRWSPTRSACRGCRSPRRRSWPTSAAGCCIPAPVLPAVEGDIPVRVLNSRKPEVEGTLIVAACPPSGLTVKSSRAQGGHHRHRRPRSTRMLMAHGFLAAIFEVFDRLQTAVDVVSTSEVAVSLTIDRTDRLADLLAALRRIADVRHTGGQAIVCLVGEAIRDTPGVAATLFSALPEINVRMVSQGSARNNVSLVIDERDVPAAVRALHAAFFDAPAAESAVNERVPGKRGPGGPCHVAPAPAAVTALPVVRFGPAAQPCRRGVRPVFRRLLPPVVDDEEAGAMIARLVRAVHADALDDGAEAGRAQGAVGLDAGQADPGIEVGETARDAARDRQSASSRSKRAADPGPGRTAPNFT